MPDTPDPMSSTRIRRLISALFGIFFVALAVLIIAASEAATRIGAIVAAMVIGGLGVDLILAVLRRKKSLLARIGPLP